MGGVVGMRGVRRESMGDGRASPLMLAAIQQQAHAAALKQQQQQLQQQQQQQVEFRRAGLALGFGRRERSERENFGFR